MTNYDGTDAFTGNVVSGDKLDKTVVWHGTALPTGGANKVPQNGLFLLVDSITVPTTQTLYIQTSATLGSPSFVAIPVPDPTIKVTGNTNVLVSFPLTLEFTAESAEQTIATFTENGTFTTPTPANANDGDFGTSAGKDTSGGTNDIGTPTTNYPAWEIGSLIHARNVHWKIGYDANGGGQGTQLWARDYNGTWSKIDELVHSIGTATLDRTIQVDDWIDMLAVTRTSSNGYNKFTPFEIKYTYSILGIQGIGGVAA